MEKLYKKVGRRYKEIGHQFTGFPADGIWLVQDGTTSQMCLIGLKENVPLRALEYRIHVDDLCKYLHGKFDGKSHSRYDIAVACCDFFAERTQNGKT